MDKKKLMKRYGKSKDGNFVVIDTIGVPHTYCVTPKHLEYSSGMNIDIEGAEEKGAVCCICKKLVNAGKQDRILSYDEHKQVLLIDCMLDIKDNKELKEYLLSIKIKCEKDKYAGFAFKKGF